MTLIIVADIFVPQLLWSSHVTSRIDHVYGTLTSVAPLHGMLKGGSHLDNRNGPTPQEVTRLRMKAVLELT